MSGDIRKKYCTHPKDDRVFILNNPEEFSDYEALSQAGMANLLYTFQLSNELVSKSHDFAHSVMKADKSSKTYNEAYVILSYPKKGVLNAGLPLTEIFSDNVRQDFANKNVDPIIQKQMVRLADCYHLATGQYLVAATIRGNTYKPAGLHPHSSPGLSMTLLGNGTVVENPHSEEYALNAGQALFMDSQLLHRGADKPAPSLENDTPENLRAVILITKPSLQ